MKKWIYTTVISLAVAFGYSHISYAQTLGGQYAPGAADAQSPDTTIAAPLFGYLSYSAALQSMADYALVQQEMADLKVKLQAELKRAESEFNLRYEEFLEGQREFPPSILKKRQSELQDLLTRNIAFRDESRKELAKAEQERMAPLRLRLNDVLRQIGLERGYAFILDTDTKALPFIHPDQGEDINQLVLDMLK